MPLSCVQTELQSQVLLVSFLRQDSDMYAWNKPYHIEPNFETQIHATKPLPVEELPRSSFLSPPRRRNQLRGNEAIQSGVEPPRRLSRPSRHHLFGFDQMEFVSLSPMDGQMQRATDATTTVRPPS